MYYGIFLWSCWETHYTPWDGFVGAKGTGPEHEDAVARYVRDFLGDTASIDYVLHEQPVMHILLPIQTMLLLSVALGLNLAKLNARRMLRTARSTKGRSV